MIKVIHVLSDTNVGGAGRWLINLLKQIDKDKFTIKVVLPEGSLLKSQVASLGVEVMQVQGMADESFDLKVILSLYKLFKKEKPDIVHTHASFSGRIAAKMAGRKIVYTRHCVQRVITNSIAKMIYRTINVLFSDKMIAVSKAVKDNFIDSGIPENMIEVIYNGVDILQEIPEADKNKLRKDLNIGQEDIVIGVVARLEEVKGHCYFLKAAKLVSDKSDNVKFLIVGSGSKENELKNMVAEQGLVDCVTFTGYVRDVEKIFNIIDINVICSLSEALCLSLIEGMSLGKPSIATDVGGIPEVVVDGYNGLLVPAEDASKLAEAVLKLAKDSRLREEMGLKGKELAEKKFTGRKMAEEIEKLYERLLL